MALNALQRVRALAEARAKRQLSRRIEESVGLFLEKQGDSTTPSRDVEPFGQKGIDAILAQAPYQKRFRPASAKARLIRPRSKRDLK